MKDNIIIALLVLLVTLFAILVFVTPHAINKAVSMSFENYLELNGYSDI